MRSNTFKVDPDQVGHWRPACSPCRAVRAVAQQQINLTAGPATATLPDGIDGADVGLQLRHGGDAARQRPAPR